MDLIGATYVRDVEPGEVLVISADGRAIDQAVSAGAARALRVRARVLRAARQLRVRPERQRGADRISAACSRASSAVDADVVVPVPDSGVCAAMGFADEAGHSAADGTHPESLRRPHVHPAAVVDPAFRRQGEAQPGAQHSRRASASCSWTIRSCAARRAGRSCRMVRAAGAKEVHVRISCPPTISPCFYGVDTPRRSELIAATHTLDEIREFLEADSVGYLSLEGLMTRGRQRTQRATARSCYTGHYPVAFPRDEKTLSAARAEARQGAGHELTMDAEPSTRRARSRVLGLCAALCALRASRRRAAARAQEPSGARRPSRPSSCRPRSTSSAISTTTTRTAASRTVRRTPAPQAVPALLQAVAEHADGYVRYRALVLLTGFNDPRTKDAMRESLASPNDRLRTVAYSFFEHNPDPRDDPAAAGRAREGAGRVRPAGARARAGGARQRPARAARRCVREVGRGEDFFRSAVIEALGDYKAQYAFDALAAVAKLDGPLQDDAALALGKIGDKRALETLAALQRTAPRHDAAGDRRRASACSASTAGRTRAISSRR